jgi:protein-disulfide isomerase
MGRNHILLGLIAAAVLAVGVAAWYVLGSGSSDDQPATSAAFVPTAYDRTLGNPKAPIVAIEYAAPQCPVCARFNAEGIPSLRSQYIDTGKVFYVFRVFPIGPADVPAESIARCLPADNYFQFIDLLYRNQAKWDPEYGVTDVQGGLVAMARIAGMNEGQALACIADKDEQKRIADGQQDAMSRYGINGTPTFVINGEVQTPGAMWPDIKAKLDSLLAKK